MLDTLRTRFAAVLFAALLAFCWQSFVVQTHVHFEPNAGVGAASGQTSSMNSDPFKGPTNTPTSCPICQEIAHDGVYLLPTPVEFDAPEPAPFWQPVATSLVRLVTKASHAWRSRAPPTQLQA